MVFKVDAANKLCQHLNLRVVEQIGDKFLKFFKREHQLVTLTLADNDRLQELNRIHKNQDRPTDILTFPALDHRDAIQALNEQAGVPVPSDVFDASRLPKEITITEADVRKYADTLEESDLLDDEPNLEDMTPDEIRAYLGIDETTQISYLSDGTHSTSSERKLTEDSTRSDLGDMFISLDYLIEDYHKTVRKRSDYYGHVIGTDFLTGKPLNLQSDLEILNVRLPQVIAHGVCHLNGLDHMTDQDHQAMLAKELALFRLVRASKLSII